MNNRWFRFILTTGIVVAAPLAAQEMAEKKEPPKKAEAGARAVPKAGPEMEKIRWLIGEWTWTDKYEDSPIAKAGVGNGTMTVKLGPGGHSLITDFRKVSERGEEIGHEIYFWDAKENVYKRVAAVSKTPGLITGTGKWEDDKLVFVWEFGAGAQKLVLRAVYSDIKPNFTTIALHASLADGPMKLLVTSTCVKK